MTPMIDVSFLLIAFFMVLINFSEADQNERIHLPVSELAKPPERPPNEPLVLQILESGKTLFGGEEYDLPALEKKLRRETVVMKTMGVHLRDAEVIIRGDRSGTTGRIRETIKLCRSLGLENYTLRAKQEIRY